MVRTERESDRRKSGRLVGAAETSKEHAEWRRLQRRNLNILGLLRKNTPEPPLPKKQSRQSRVPDHDGRKSQGEPEPHLGEKKGDQSESVKTKEWTPS